MFIFSGTTVANSPLLQCETVTEIAQKSGKSSAQILLRWAIQKGFSVLPKSTNPIHISENSQIDDFVISEEDMQILDNLDNGQKFAWNPKIVV